MRKNSLSSCYAYVDHVTVCGKTKGEHDVNLKRFMDAAAKAGLTLNHDKCLFATQTIDLLGYRIAPGSLKPDPERLSPLLNLPAPETLKGLQRVVGMFAYYAKWIQNFSDKIHPLNNVSTFPLNGEALKAFSTLKNDLAEASMQPIDEDKPFVLETDASEFSIAAVLCQEGRPVAFHSRTLQGSEKHRASVEKEAQAIVESIQHWRHFLLGRHFTLITDQRSVAYMYDTKTASKIKNEKILRWRVELSPYSYNVSYRPGPENVAADTFSRTSCAMSTQSLTRLHDILCHPGVTRLFHFVRSKNLPFSIDDVKRVCANCTTCPKVKPNFHKPQRANLIKATQPMERLSIDFKGPIPNAKNPYMLTLVDEYSRFPFAYAVKDMTTETVKKCLRNLFSIFGLTSFVHNDIGPSLVSQELNHWLIGQGVACSRTTPYNPTGNGQVERYNGIIWKSVLLALEQKKLPVSQWEVVLPEALHSIRSLLCTSTNCTPHERFFSFIRKSATGSSIPTWLHKPGKVLMKRNVRQSKYEPTVDEVELIQANPQYAHVRLADGRETTVSLKQLAPVGEGTGHEMPEEHSSVGHGVPLLDSSIPSGHEIPVESRTDHGVSEEFSVGHGKPSLDSSLPSAETQSGSTNNADDHSSSDPPLRRSQRVRKPPTRLDL